MCVCIYIYICIHTHIYTHIHTVYIYIYIYIYINYDFRAFRAVSEAMSAESWSISSLPCNHDSSHDNSNNDNSHANDNNIDKATTRSIRRELVDLVVALSLFSCCFFFFSP